MSFLYKPKTKSGNLIKFSHVFHEILVINGAWPTEKDADDFKSNLYYVFGWILLLNCIFINSCQIGSLLVNLTDIITAAQAFCTAMTGIFIVLRSLYFRLHLKKLVTLMNRFAEDIWIDEEKYPHIVQKCQQVMRPVFLYFIFIFIALILYSTLPAIVFFRTNQTLDSRDKLLPFLMIFPYDEQQGTSYVITYISAVHGGWIISSHFYAYDAILILFVSYLCGQFEILHGDIVRLIPECHAEWQSHYGKNRSLSDNYNATWEAGHIRILQDMYTKRLHEISAHHSQLISFCDQLNDLVSIPLMLNIVCSTFLVCFCGFQFLISGTTSLADFTMFLCFFISVLVQLYVLCTSGTLLISISSETGAYLYSCNWEGGQLSKMSPLMLLSKDMNADSLNDKLPLWKSIKYCAAGKDFRNKLRFMIMRCHRPLELNAMNFTVISLECFSAILSSSMSYFALLKNFLDE